MPSFGSGISYDPTAEMQKGIKTYKLLKFFYFKSRLYDPTAEMQKGIKTMVKDRLVVVETAK